LLINYALANDDSESKVIAEMIFDHKKVRNKIEGIDYKIRREKNIYLKNESEGLFKLTVAGGTHGDRHTHGDRYIVL